MFDHNRCSRDLSAADMLFRTSKGTTISAGQFRPLRYTEMVCSLSMEWTERTSFNASEPSAGGLAAMAGAIGPETAEVAEVRRLVGGVDAATHAVRLDPGGWFVLKRVPETSRQDLESEFHRLHFACSVPVATPEPVAFDAEGAWFGHPALVMSMLEGRPTFHPSAEGGWLDSLAGALAAIHSTRLDDDVPSVIRAPHAGQVWEPASPEELPRTAMLEALIAAASGIRGSSSLAPDVLLHHDFHHGNVIWRGAEVSGVLDWNEARLGPAVCDVAYCSVDLTMTHGAEAGRSFVRAYEALSGEVDDLVRWQCLWVANAHRWIPYWMTGFRDAGIDLTVDRARERLDVLSEDLVERI
jgi:aminoglycoside phosphotransferase (APT) family kinase protein